MNVMVLGEKCADIYLYTEHTRQSPENILVPVLKVNNQITKWGMSYNVATNLFKLGVNVYDKADGHTITKTRVFEKDKQIARIDVDYPARNCSEQEILDFINLYKTTTDAIIVEDYGKGWFTPAIYNAVFSSGIKTFVDPSKNVNFNNYKNCYLLKPNLEEAKTATGETSLPKIFRKLFEITNAQMIVITDGDNGMHAKTQQQNFIDSMPALSTRVVDVTGCGDTCIASLTYAIMNGYELNKAIEFASKAAAVCVEQFGVYAPTLKEIQDRK